jgi:hypothetical protein
MNGAIDYNLGCSAHSTPEQFLYNHIGKMLDRTPYQNRFSHDRNPHTMDGMTENKAQNSAGDRGMLMSLDSVELVSGEFLCNDFALLYSSDLLIWKVCKASLI